MSSEIKTVALSSIHPNPHRDAELFPLREDRIEKLVSSIEAEGFWESVIARPRKGGGYEIAFGHHRIEAARRALGKDSKVSIIVRELTNEEMVRFMERENLSDGLGFYYTTVQVVRAWVLGFGAGVVKLAKVKTGEASRTDVLRVAPSFLTGAVSPGECPGTAYNADTLAAAMGRQQKPGKRGAGPEATEDIRLALDILEGMERGIMTREDVDLKVQRHIETLASVQRAALRAQKVKTAEIEAKVSVLEEAKAVAAKNDDQNRVEVIEKEIKSEKAKVEKAPDKAAKSAVKEAGKILSGGGSVKDVQEQVIEPIRQEAKKSVKKVTKKAVKTVNGWAAADFDTAITAAERARSKYEEWTEGAAEGASNCPKKVQDYIAINDRLIAQIQKMNKALKGAK